MPGPCEHTIQMPGAGALECTGKLQEENQPVNKRELLMGGRLGRPG